MSEELVPGLYEALLTEELRGRIERARRAGRRAQVEPVDDAALADILARHVHDEALAVLAGLPSSLPDRRAAQVEVANRLIRELRAPYGEDVAPVVDPDPHVLLEVVDGPAARATPRPGISLRDSVLLTNGHRDLQIGTQLALEIQSADRIDLLSAFVRFAGIRLIRRELQEFLLRGGEMRVIASVYTGSTEKRALDELAGLGARVKVSYETDQTRLHAKAWLFERNSGFHTAYVGSSNLTSYALLEGLEWNVRATAVDNPRIVARVAATFEQYWHEPEFASYDPRVDGDRLQAALDAQRPQLVGGTVLRPGRAEAPVDDEPMRPLPAAVAPKPFQDQMLEGLAAERQRGHLRNLVVAPTGTGKTWVSAFDYARLRAQGYERLLFVAHRELILDQSQRVFRSVLGDPAFGERHVGSERPGAWSHVFASIQSLHRGLDRIPPDHFDVVVVDEFHHAEADTYRRLLGHLRPRVLLGLTATPERADGREILHWFDDRVATEMRLWDALDQGLLCPFHYLGIGDETDLRGVAFQRGRYVTADLEGVLTGDHVRARRIIDAVREWVLDPTRMRALGFCAGIGHARFMAAQFEAAGLRAVALDGSSTDAARDAAIDRLRRGDLQAIFTVDIFNEGVDIPEADTLLLLRPTESATVFLQQLGRGLRWADGKSVLTVLDFIGQAHRDYRFDVKFRALIGGTRRQLERAIEHGFPLMPPGCAIRLDEIAQEAVLANLRAAITSTRKLLVDDLRAMPPTTRLPEFVAASAHDLPDVYRNPSAATTFTALRRDAGHLRTAEAPGEREYAKAIGRLLHVDDEERYTTWSTWLAGPTPPRPAAPGSREERLQWMLFAALGLRAQPLADLQAEFAAFWSQEELRRELIDLLAVLRERTRLDSRPLAPGTPVPLHTHATYGLYELLAAYNVVANGRLREVREGVVWVPDERTDLLLVTLNKDEADFSPTTRYNDYPISSTLFHWESQSRTATASPTGQRYIRHRAQGSEIVLFVRENRRDERDVSGAYLCLGRARYVSHRSERPMQIVWDLERPMPAELYQRAKVAAG